MNWLRKFMAAARPYWKGFAVVGFFFLAGLLLFARGLIFKDGKGYILNSYSEVFVGIMATYFVVSIAETNRDEKRKKQLEEQFQAQEVKRRKEQLPKRAASRAHSIAIGALEEICEEDWHIEGGEDGKSLLEGCDFSKARFEGAVLKKAKLCGSALKEAALTEAEMNGADLTGVDLTGANLRGANLEGAHLCDIVVDEATNFGNAILNNAVFSIDVDSSRTNISKAVFTGAKLINAQMVHIIASNTNFASADISGADFTNAHLHGAIMHEAILLAVDNSPTLLVNANLTDANLSNIQGDEANFSRATLSGVRFEAAKANGANFTRATLNNADLKGAELRRAKFIGAKLYGAHFEGADLYGAEFWDAEEINAAHFDETTILPDGTRWKEGKSLGVWVYPYEETRRPVSEASNVMPASAITKTTDSETPFVPELLRIIREGIDIDDDDE